MFVGQAAQGQASSAFTAAVQWTESALLGTFATSLAVIAVAFVGLRLLSGQLSPAAMMRVVVGCFILFGAPSIASGIMAAARGGYAGMAAQAPVTAPAAVPTSRPGPFDPYAGAAAPGN
jgi:type IV secretory pathway VirB2 component (pilin)